MVGAGWWWRWISSNNICFFTFVWGEQAARRGPSTNSVKGPVELGRPPNRRTPPSYFPCARRRSPSGIEGGALTSLWAAAPRKGERFSSQRLGLVSISCLYTHTIRYAHTHTHTLSLFNYSQKKVRTSHVRAGCWGWGILLPCYLATAPRRKGRGRGGRACRSRWSRGGPPPSPPATTLYWRVDVCICV